MSNQDYGIVFYNGNNIVTIDGNYINAHLVAKGYFSDLTDGGYAQEFYYGELTVPGSYDLIDNPPIILLKPSAAGGWVGGVSYGNNSDGSWTVSAYGSVPFSIAVFSNSGTPITLSKSSDYGFEVFDTSGNIVFTSSRGYARLQNLVTFPSGSEGIGVNSTCKRWPKTMGVGYGGTMPWFFGNALPLSLYTSDVTTGDRLPMACAKYDGAGTITVDMMTPNNGDTSSTDRLIQTYRTDPDPFYGTPVLFGAGISQPWENY